MEVTAPTVEPHYTLKEAIDRFFPGGHPHTIFLFMSKDRAKGWRCETLPCAAIRAAAC